MDKSALVDALVALLVADAKHHSREEIEAEAVKATYSKAHEISHLQRHGSGPVPDPPDELEPEIDWASITFTWAPRPVPRRAR